MCKVLLVFGLLCAAMVAESWAQRDEPLWLYQDPDIPRAPASSDHPYLPSIIDDIKLDPNRRTARSLPGVEPWRPTPFNPRVPLPDFPTPRPLFPNYARYARDVEDVELEPELRLTRSLPNSWRTPPFNPRIPQPDFPTPRPRFPVYARSARDVEGLEEVDSEVRVARSLGTPRSGRGGGGFRRTGSRDSGPTHPGYNRRNARFAPRYPHPTPFNPRAPNPFPRPSRPAPVPTLARSGRDTHHVQFDFDGQKDLEFGSHEDFGVVDG